MKLFEHHESIKGETIASSAEVFKRGRSILEKEVADHPEWGRTWTKFYIERMGDKAFLHIEIHDHEPAPWGQMIFALVILVLFIWLLF